MRAFLTACLLLSSLPAQARLTPGPDEGRAVPLPERKPEIGPLGVKPPPDRTAKYRPLIEKYAKKYGVDADLVHAIMKRENPWGDPKRKSAAGAVGLMQLMPDTAKWLGVNPYTDEGNIEGGVKYAAYLLEVFEGDVVLAVAAYNSGDSAVGKVGRVPNIRQTVDYVAHVFNHYYWLTGKKVDYDRHMTDRAKGWVADTRAYDAP